MFLTYVGVQELARRSARAIAIAEVDGIFTPVADEGGFAQALGLKLVARAGLGIVCATADGSRLLGMSKKDAVLGW